MQHSNLSAVEEAAFPFLECAVLLDRTRQGQAELAPVLDLNAARWLEIANRSGGLPAETSEFLGRAGRFMAEAAYRLRREPSEEVIDTMIRLNLNMSETILSAVN